MLTTVRPSRPPSRQSSWRPNAGRRWWSRWWWRECRGHDRIHTTSSATIHAPPSTRRHRRRHPPPPTSPAGPGRRPGTPSGGVGHSYVLVRPSSRHFRHENGSKRPRRRSSVPPPSNLQTWGSTPAPTPPPDPVTGATNARHAADARVRFVPDAGPDLRRRKSSIESGRSGHESAARGHKIPTSSSYTPVRRPHVVPRRPRLSHTPSTGNPQLRPQGARSRAPKHQAGRPLEHDVPHTQPRPQARGIPSTRQKGRSPHALPLLPSHRLAGDRQPDG